MNHIEPGHSGALPYVLEGTPGAQLAVREAAKSFIVNIYLEREISRP